MNEEFKKKIIALRGDGGKKWLNGLPEIIRQYEQKWNLVVFPPFNLTYNYVAPAKIYGGKNVVLKISFPKNTEFASEIEALKFFNGIAAVRVLQEDIQNGVALLEKAEPGERLRSISPDSKQISIASEVIKKLHKPITNDLVFPFPTVSDWGKAFDRYKKETGFLHGDLHSDNILSSERGWLAIDPKGVIGEREFELGAYLRNPIYDYPKGSDYKKLETQRIIQISERLGFDQERLLGWSFACAVISILWFLEDEDRFSDVYLQNAEILEEIKF